MSLGLGRDLFPSVQECLEEVINAKFQPTQLRYSVLAKPSVFFGSLNVEDCEDHA